MPAQELAGVRDKISRGQHHIEQVNAAIEAMMGPEERPPLPDAPPYRYDPDRQEVIIYARPPKPSDPSIPLMIGDAVHNLRSALDHLVFQLALANGNSNGADKTAFPIYTKEKSFKNFIQNNLAPFVSAAALAKIERLQPYKTDHPPENAELWALSQLDIFDKHRLLVVAVQKIKPVACEVSVPSGNQFRFDIPQSPWKPLEDGAEIIRFDLSKAIDRPGKVNVKMRTITQVHLMDTGLTCDGAPIQFVLSRLGDRVSGIVDEFGKMFFRE